MALVDCQFQSCLADAIRAKVRSIIGCDCNVVHVLNTVVSFDNWVQVLAHEARKSRHRSAETLFKSFVGKSSAGKTECKHSHRALVRHLQAVISLRAIKLAE